jgi:hypothetical protein
MVISLKLNEKVQTDGSCRACVDASFQCGIATLHCVSLHLKPGFGALNGCFSLRWMDFKVSQTEEKQALNH